MPILQLIIAHLLGDFVFQPNSLIKWKHESWKGTFVHSLIICGFSALLVFPYLISVKAFFILFLLFLAHFVQDMLKILYQNRANLKPSMWPFFLDQCSHLFFILLFGTEFSKLVHFELPPAFKEIYYSTNLMVFAALALFFTFTMDIVIFEMYRIHHKEAKYRRDYCAIVNRLISFIVLYVVFLLLIAFGK